jgi:arabinogalactan oligomer / maltooligosaccharide transport system substrate-binding protein
MNHMSRLKTVNVLAGVVIAMVMVFGTAISASAHPVHQGKPKTTITIWDYFATQGQGFSPERKAFINTADKWAAHHNATISEPVRPSSGYETAFTQGAKAGKAGDIVMFPDNESGVYYSQHLLQPLSLKASKFVPQAVQAVTQHGTTFALPWALETMMLYYNTKIVHKSLFKKGYTWDTIAKWSAKYADSHPGSYGMAWNWDNFYYDYDFFTPYGGGVFARSGGGYNTKHLLLTKAVSGVEYLKKVITESKTPINTFLTSNNGDTNAQDLFETGKLGMIFDGPWSDSEWKNAKLTTFAVAAPPAFPGKKEGQPFLGVQTIGVNRFSKHLKLAESLAAYLDANAQSALFHVGGRIPALKSVLKSVQNGEVKQYEKAFTHTQALPNIAQMGAVWGPAATALTQYLSGAKTAKAALSAAQSAILKAGG